MRLVIQRVNSAQVKVSGNIVGKINTGLFVLVGVNAQDSEKDTQFLAEKLSKIRLMKDDQDKINLSVKETGADLLIVSQFTLYADTKGGNRPSFINASEPEKAKNLYDLFIRILKEKGIRVETGEFGKYMEITTELDGPVTIIIDSKDI